MKGENKKQFEKWLRVNEFEDLELFERIFEDFFFMELPFEMQIGVLSAYYDSLGIYIIIDKYVTPNEFNFSLVADKEINSLYFQGVFKSRNEAYKEAFKKADEIINEQLTNK